MTVSGETDTETLTPAKHRETSRRCKAETTLFWKHLAPVCLCTAAAADRLNHGFTLVRLGQGILSLQKLLHFVFVLVGETSARGEKKQSERQVCFQSHYFPSEWHFRVPDMMIPADSSHSGLKIIPQNRHASSYWLAMLHGSSLLVPFAVNHSARFSLDELDTRCTCCKWK